MSDLRDDRMRSASPIDRRDLNDDDQRYAPAPSSSNLLTRPNHDDPPDHSNGTSTTSRSSTQYGYMLPLPDPAFIGRLIGLKGATSRSIQLDSGLTLFKLGHLPFPMGGSVPVAELIGEFQQIDRAIELVRETLAKELVVEPSRLLEWAQLDPRYLVVMKPTHESSTSAATSGATSLMKKLREPVGYHRPMSLKLLPQSLGDPSRHGPPTSGSATRGYDESRLSSLPSRYDDHRTSRSGRYEDRSPRRERSLSPPPRRTTYEDEYDDRKRRRGDELPRSTSSRHREDDHPPPAPSSRRGDEYSSGYAERSSRMRDRSPAPSSGARRDRSRSRERPYDVELPVPAAVVPALIGAGGRAIKDLSARSGVTHLRVSGAHGPTPIVCIRGSNRAIERCVDEIELVVRTVEKGRPGGAHDRPRSLSPAPRRRSSNSRSPSPALPARRVNLDSPPMRYDEDRSPRR